MTALRVRQIVTAVGDVDVWASEAVDAGLPFVYVDPGVGHFGARNSLHAAGDTFVELLGEKDAGSPVGRHLARLGGDGGYMVIIQVDDLDAHATTAGDLGVRSVWSGGIEGIRGTHFHPSDVGGAILSLDQADPPESWSWCGPEWTGGTPAVAGAPIDAIEVTAADPDATARRWASLLHTDADGSTVRLAGTTIDFLPDDDRPSRLVAAHIEGIGDLDLGGIHLHG